MLSNDDLIAELVDSHKATGRVWSPVMRSFAAVVTLFSLQGIFFGVMAPYNEEALDLLMKSPRFFIELFSAFLFTFMLFLFFFTKIIPGALVSNKSLWTLRVSGTLLILSLLYTFIESSPSVVTSGGRYLCELQVIILGIIPLPIFYWLSRKGVFWRDQKTFIASGVAASMVPAFFMELACKNDTLHSIPFHYGPTLLIGIFYLIVFQNLSKKLSQ